MKTRTINLFIFALLTALLSLTASAQRTLPLPSPQGIMTRGGEAPLYYLDPPFSGSQSDTGEAYGTAIAMNPSLIVVGAPLETENGNAEAGAVYVYRPNGAGGWIEAQRLTAPVPAAGAHFGAAVDIHGSADGAWILIGSPGALVDPTPTPGDELPGAGKIYLFKPGSTAGTWDFNTAVVSQSPDENGAFGSVVDIWDNGSPEPTMLIGAPGEIPFSLRTGAVYLYQFSAGLPAPFPEQFTPSDQQADMRFGAAIARGDSGATPRFFVGAPNFDTPTTNAGQVYSFTNISSYIEDANLGSPSPHANGNFGAAIAGYYNGADVYTMAVGAPGELVSVFARAGRTYVYTDDLNIGTGFGLPTVLTAGSDIAASRKFGSSLMLRDIEGMRRLVVGAPTDDATNVGRVYLLDESSGAWAIEETLLGNDNRTDGFGYDVHIEEQDGSTVVVVGAPKGRPDVGVDETPGAMFFFQRPAPGVTFDTAFTAPYISSEDGLASHEYTLVLNTPPTDDVTITIGYTGDDCVIADAVRDDNDTAVFTSTDWMMPFSVKVQAINDDIDEIDETCTITHTSSSSDPDYNGLSIPSVDVTVVSDDVAGIATTYENTPSFTLSEDETQTDILFLHLTSEPTGIVSIVASFADDCEFFDGTVTTSRTFTFTPANWDTNQSAEIRAINDTLTEGAETCTLSIAVNNDDTLDSVYDAVSPITQTFTVVDDESAGVTTSLVSNTPPFVLSEDGTQTEVLSVRLNTEPSGQVTINLTFTGDDCLLVDNGNRDSLYSMTFTSISWNIDQTVDIQAFDDAEIEGAETCTLALETDDANTTDPFYDVVTIPSINFDITDNDLITGVELVRNGGMEDSKPNKPKLPDQWTFKKFAGKDQRICPGSGSPLVHSGDCSVQLAGTKNPPRSILRSTRTKIDLVENLGLELSTDDTVRVQFRYKINARTDGLVRIVAFRNFGGDRTVLARVELPHPVDENYDQWLTFDQTFTVTTTDFRQLRLIIKDFSLRGKWWVDDVSFIYTDNGGGGSRLPLP